MKREKEKVNFSAPIPGELKERIDRIVAQSDVPIGKVVKRLAEWVAEMTPEELRMFVYGPGGEKFQDYIHQRVVEALKSEECQEMIAALCTTVFTEAPEAPGTSEK